MSTLYCYTIADSTHILIPIRVYLIDIHQGYPWVTCETVQRGSNYLSSKRKSRLTPKQERQRIEGLRMLARIIARHYLANPHLYGNGAGGASPVVADGDTARKEGTA